MSISDIDLEQGGYGDRRRSFGESEVSVYYSDGEEVRSGFSYFYSTESYEDEEEEEESRKVSSERDCRICHMGVELTSGGIELGCSCKHDLAIAHKKCAETWFKIKGDKICEICQSVARNVGAANEMVRPTEEAGELRNGGGETTTVTATAVEVESGGNRWQPQKVVNLVLACMVFGFFISWLFHFHVSSSS